MPKRTLDRSSLDGEEIFRNLREILNWLVLGYQPVYHPPQPGTTSLQALQQPATSRIPITWEPLSPDDTRRLQVVLTTQLKLLSKVLPDLKAVEVNDLTSSASKLDPNEFNQRAASIMHMLGTGRLERTIQ